MVKIGGDLETGLNHLEASWVELFPNTPARGINFSIKTLCRRIKVIS